MIKQLFNRACCAALAAGFLSSSSALGGGTAQPGLVTAPVAGGLRIFDVQDLGAPRSSAIRIQQAGTGKGVGVQVAGWALTSQIAVETNDLAGLRLAMDTQGVRVQVRPAEGVAGFAIVEAPTIIEATAIARNLWASGKYASVEMVTEHPRVLRGPIGDLLAQQWHLNNTTNPQADVNADGAWNQGFTGAGVIIGIVEDAFQEQHPDLAANYVPLASMPSAFDSVHATSTAGIAAAVGTNTAGGSGIAYNAGIAAQVFGLSSASTANALGFASDITDIKSNSWGPPDRRWLEPIPAIEKAAIVNAAISGRGGLGTIFTWAAGNGGPRDRVDYDSWASNRFTIAVGAIGFTDTEAFYNEIGASMFVVAHSDGGGRGITTTDLMGAAGYDPGNYTSSFGGTSAASPLAAGAIALTLEANPGLSRRDVMHLLVNTARKCDPTDPSWVLNGAGHDISERFGFGAVDAGALVTAAQSWQSVGPEVSKSSGVISVGQVLPDNDPNGLSRSVVMPAGVKIEAVELTLNATSQYMGDVDIMLFGPSGSASAFAHKRPDPTTSVVNFTFTSFRHFGEDSGGTWTIRLADRVAADLTTWQNFELRIYGTSCPADMNGDGILDNGDISLFAASFIAGDLAVDMNGDGVLDNGDIGAFVQMFLAGC